MKLSISFIIYFLLNNLLFAQENAQKIFIQKNRYNIEIQKNSRFENYKFFGKYYIDRYNQNIIDYNQVIEGVNLYYPNREDSGYLMIDLENQIYQNLKSKDSVLRGKAVNKFKQLIGFIKSRRPNIKVGLYGIPFSFNYDFQKKYNHDHTLEDLLKVVDFLSPSLYFSYSEQQQNIISLKKFAETNLQLFLDYGQRVNKPVYVYVWYSVHPYNKRYGGQIVSKERMECLLSILKTYKYNSKSVDGIIWWEPMKSEINKANIINYNKRTLSEQPSINEILSAYTENF